MNKEGSYSIHGIVKSLLKELLKVRIVFCDLVKFHVAFYGFDIGLVCIFVAKLFEELVSFKHQVMGSLENITNVVPL